MIHLMLARLREITGADSDAALADKIDVERSAICLLRQGRHLPSITFIHRAHQYGGMPLDELFSYLPPPIRNGRKTAAAAAANRKASAERALLARAMRPPVPEPIIRPLPWLRYLEGFEGKDFDSADMARVHVLVPGRVKYVLRKLVDHDLIMPTGAVRKDFPRSRGRVVYRINPNPKSES